MAEKSILWTTGGAGDGSATYTQDEVTRLYRHLIGGDPATQFVLPGVDNELAPSGTSSPVQIATGSAFVYGFFYWNDAPLNVVIPTPVIGTTGHRIVLRADFTARTVRVTLKSSSDGVGTIPGVTQTPGSTYEVSIATLTITTGGVITLTDARGFVYSATKVATAMLDDNLITNAKLRDSTGMSVIGRSTSIDGDPADIAAGTDGHILRRSGSTIGFGQIALGGIPDELITPAKIQNRTRSFLVMAQFHDQAESIPGLALTDGVTDYAFGYFVVPNDFVSNMVVRAIVIPNATGNVYAQNYVFFGGIGENYQANNTFAGFSAVAVTINLNNAILQMNMTGAAAGDLASLFFQRQAGNASDTINDTVFIKGWLVEYTADS